MAWEKTISVNIMEFFKKFFLYCMPLYNKPKNKIVKERLKLYENSPASVLGIFPPHIEFPSLNKNGKVNIAANIGKGNLNFIIFIAR